MSVPREEFTVKAYSFTDGKFTLSEWASGFYHDQADKYFKQLRETNSFAKIEMFQTNKRVKEYGNEIRN